MYRPVPELSQAAWQQRRSSQGGVHCFVGVGNCQAHGRDRESDEVYTHHMEGASESLNKAGNCQETTHDISE